MKVSMKEETASYFNLLTCKVPLLTTLYPFTELLQLSDISLYEIGRRKANAIEDCSTNSVNFIIFCFVL